MQPNEAIMTLVKVESKDKGESMIDKGTKEQGNIVIPDD